MKLILDNNQLSETPEMFLRQAGYAYLIDRNTGSESFVRPLNRGYYPRFHLYLEQSNGQVIFNLHLDQKQASYAGAHAHNAEYDGETVAEETERIKELAAQSSPASASRGRDGQPMAQDVNAKISQEILDKIRPEHFSVAAKKEEKKSWWKFWK